MIRWSYPSWRWTGHVLNGLRHVRIDVSILVLVCVMFALEVSSWRWISDVLDAELHQAVGFDEEPIRLGHRSLRLSHLWS